MKKNLLLLVVRYVTTTILLISLLEAYVLDHWEGIALMGFGVVFGTWTAVLYMEIDHEQRK